MNVLGIDPGLASLGWALMRGKQLLGRGCVVTKRNRRATGDVWRRLEEIGVCVREQLKRAELVVIEWPSGGGGFGGNGGAAAQVHAVAGFVAGLATRIPTLAPAPVTWRAELGHAQGKDGQLHAELAERYRVELRGLRKGALPHVLDAIGLALYGAMLLDPKQRSVMCR